MQDTLARRKHALYGNGMQMMMIYSSPRKRGNSTTLAKTFAQAAKQTYTLKEVFLQDEHLEPCRDCRWCKTHFRCVIEDEMNDLCQAFRESDAICFATPVYWWGFSAQLKLFIDRLYQLKLDDFKGKRLYVIATGEDTLDGVQYRLIREQFEAICEYTAMQFAGYLPVCAGDDNPAKENEEALEQARNLLTKA